MWVRPIGLLSGATARRAVADDAALPLAGGPLAFTQVELGDGGCVPAPPRAAELRAWTAPRPAWAGFALDRPLVMGIVNVTPDSFSDGGDFLDAAAAIAQGRRLREEGADILDIGGESTRPGAAPTPSEEEARRVVPVVRALAADGAVVSIDTRRAAVMRAALDAGARIVNDVTALAGDPESLGVVAASGVPVILMHMRGDPASMQQEARYGNLIGEIWEELAARLHACDTAGIRRDNVLLDPGIGFAKTAQHNLELLGRLATLHGLGSGLLVGASRKSFIGKLSRGEAARDRVPGSLAAALAALGQGAQMLRVHDVAATRQAIAVWQSLTTSA